MMQSDLNLVREHLNARRLELAERTARVDSDLARRNESLSTDSEDRAIQIQNDDVLQAIATGAGAEIAEIDSALQRLDLNLYGICSECRKPIPRSRLEAAPYATRCAACTENRNTA